MKQKLVKFSFLILLIIAFGACTPQKKLIYFQSDTPKDSVYSYIYPKDKSEFVEPYRLTSNDELYINVVTDDERNQKMFGAVSSINYGANETSIYMNSYKIDDKGYITFPAVGPVYLKGMTIEEARQTLEEKAREYDLNAIVICKLVNFRVDILGEVNRPGRYNFYQDKVSIFTAIATAGDLTYHAKRTAVKIVRKENNKDIIYTLNVNNADILQNPNYFLKSGDIIFVEPNKATKNFSNFNIPMSTIASSLSIISTAITVILLVLQLKDK
ncbi:MAG: polysaccharide biosynthesis/export family protein [Bacteroidales bacterium]|jgi:polysaccharide export outer membrane protein|nr:polysaccharide biosynthesis/export family protein [Bacteroidales bacterium]